MVVLSRRAALGVGLVLLSGGFAPAMAAETTPKQLILSIYQTYLGKNAKGYDWNEPKAARAAFSAELAKLILDEAAKSKGEIGVLDFDPLIDAQDYKLSDIKVDVKETDATHASADVSFINFGSHTRQKMLLVKEKNGWRIDDIVWGGEDRGTLKSLYKNPQ